jgi:hypothetical protein
MAQFGSNRSIASQAFVNLTDQLGNPLVSTDSSFGSSPLGTAPLTQAFFGLPNATFNLTPPDVLSVIDGTNPMPYWDVENSSNLVMSATSTYDATTETWGVKLDPGTAVSGDTLILKTRSYLVNDDNLGLRQKAFAVIAKNGTYSGSTQWNLQMSATYYSATDTALHTAVIGTALDNATWTSLSGFTTTSGTAISASARYVDLAFTLTATATVTSATSVTIKSALLSTKVGANSSFLVTETFTSSGSWVRPTGVTNLVGVIAIGAGGGGGGGGVKGGTATVQAMGGGGGGSSAWTYAQNLYVGDVGTVTIGIGAGGIGGTAGTYSKTGGGGSFGTAYGGVGATGGATTFGSYISIPGGVGGSANSTSAGTVSAGGAGGGAPTTTVYGLATLSSVGGATTLGSGVLTTNVPDASGTTSAQYATSQMPIYSTLVAGSAGGTATVTLVSGTVLSATANFGASGPGGGAGFIASGGAGGWGGDTNDRYRGGGTGGNGGGGGGGGGLRYQATNTNNGTAVLTFVGGPGGAGAANSGAGGGGGGGIYWSWPINTQSVQGTATAGTGGAGASGLVVVAYIA